jgi:murein DD-endopeptidase MepM/ murein hydrolase activator NlpD
MEINYKSLEKKLLVLQNAMSSIEQRDDQLYRMVLGVAPMDDALRNGGVGGALRYAEIRNISSGNADRILELNVKVDRLRRKLYMESVSQDEVLQWAESKKELFAATPAIQPISSGPLVTRTSGFGMRMDPFYRVIALHTGIDFAAPEGTPVYATADGEIIAADALAYGYGKMITIDHGHGYLTRYAHLLECKARVGTHVKRGERIALVGNTGLSTAAHLHYEVIFEGTIVDPINYFFADITPTVYNNITKVSSAREAMIGN